MARLELAQQQKNSEQVAQLLSEIEKNFGDTVDVRLAKARVLVNQKGKEAVPELAAFAQNLDQITGTSERLQLYYQLARLCLSAGEPAQGLVYGRQAAELAPNSLQIRMFLLQVARSAMDVEAAGQMAAEIEKIEQGGAVTLFSQALYELTAMRRTRKIRKMRRPCKSPARPCRRPATNCCRPHKNGPTGRRCLCCSARSPNCRKMRTTS